MRASVVSELDQKLCFHKDILQDWVELVSAYKADACRELSLIYEKLTGKRVDERQFSVLSGSNVLYDHQHVYLYMLAGNFLYYGPEQKLYPVEDESLWPWTAKNKPIPMIHFSRDIALSISRYMTPFDIISLSLTCRTLRHLFTSDYVWRPYFNYLRETFREEYLPTHSWEGNYYEWFFENFRDYYPRSFFNQTQLFDKFPKLILSAVLYSFKPEAFLLRNYEYVIGVQGEWRLKIDNLGVRTFNQFVFQDSLGLFSMQNMIMNFMSLLCKSKHTTIVKNLQTYKSTYYDVVNVLFPEKKRKIDRVE